MAMAAVAWVRPTLKPSDLMVESLGAQKPELPRLGLSRYHQVAI